MADTNFSKWLGGPNFNKMKKWGNGANNQKLPRRGNVLGALASAYAARNGKRDRDFLAKYGRPYFIL